VAQDVLEVLDSGLMLVSGQRGLLEEAIQLADRLENRGGDLRKPRSLLLWLGGCIVFAHRVFMVAANMWLARLK